MKSHPTRTMQSQQTMTTNRYCEQAKRAWQYTMGQGETRIGKNRIERGDTDNIKQSHELLIIKE